MKVKKITIPFPEDTVCRLKAGDEVLLSGVIYTARDAAHKKFHEMIKGGKKIPIAFSGAVIYYAGPTPPAPGKAIGSCGPTTASRMDAFTPELIELGLSGMIGKGDRSADVIRAMRKRGAVYFVATGGIGALLSSRVKKAKVVLFKELGPEAVYRLEVADFPVIVGIDSKGNDIYGKARRKKE